MSDDGLISVIVAVYNIKEYLPRCVESLIKQSYRELEIILVDDGSDDGSGELCDEYARQDARIRVVHKKNGGLSDARNAGLAIVKGKYIGYVDGDDFIEADMYERMLAALTAQDAQVAVCDFRQLGGSGQERRTTGEVVGLSREEALEIYICGHRQYRIYPSVWSKLFVRELVAEIRFAVGKSSEDIMYTTEAFCRMKRCVYLDVACYNYIVDRAGSIMNKKTGERRFACEIPIWKEQEAFLREQGLEVLAEKSAYYFYRRMLFYYVDFKDKGQQEFAERLFRLLKSEEERIREVYRNEWATRGDRVRMTMMLKAHGWYYRAVKLYEKYWIPYRQKS